jgi:hypothetical protein
MARTRGAADLKAWLRQPAPAVSFLAGLGDEAGLAYLGRVEPLAGAADHGDLGSDLVAELFPVGGRAGGEAGR